MQAKYYWLQECIQAGVLIVEMIWGALNPADDEAFGRRDDAQDVCLARLEVRGGPGAHGAEA